MKRGFTLIEAMIVITVFIIVSGAIFSFVTAFYRAQNLLFVQSDLLEEARRGMSQMVREIRKARSGEDGSFIITRAGDHEIIFHSDLTGDGITERVRYRLEQNNLFLKDVFMIGGWPPVYGNIQTTIISRNIRNAARGRPIFLYYDRNGLLIGNPGARIKEIRMVKINMILNPERGRPPGDFSLISMAQLRNHR